MFLILKLLLCSCFVGVSYAKSEKEIREWFVGLGLECNKEIEITAEDMQALHEHKVPDNESSKCFLNCIYTKATWMNNKGMFDVESANKMIEKEHLDEPSKAEISKKLFDLCKNVNDEAVSDGEKGCERAALLTKCIVGNGPKMGISLGI